MGVRAQPHAPAASTPGKDPVPIVQVGWAPGPVWTGAEDLVSHRDLIAGQLLVIYMVIQKDGLI